MTAETEKKGRTKNLESKRSNQFHELTPAKTCIVTHIFSKSGGILLDISQYFLVLYSQKINADYFCISEPPAEKHLTWYGSLKYFRRLLDSYDRVIYIDPDTIVSPNCPDLTQVCPENVFGAYFESDMDSRLSCIEAAKLIYGDIPNWNNDYFNMGVMVLSKKHRKLFNDPDKYLLSEQYIQTYLNWQLFKIETAFLKLDARYNYMPGLFGGVPGDAHIVHFAGAGRMFGKLLLNKHNMDAWIERTTSSGVPSFERQKDAAILSMKIYQMRDMAAVLRGRKTQFTMGAPMFAYKPSIDRFLDKNGMFFAKLPDVVLDCAVTGPYVTLTPGCYRLFLEMPRDHTFDDVEIEFDVATVLGRLGLLPRRRMKLSQLIEGVDFQVFATAEDVEFRFSLLGQGFPFYAARLETIH